MDALAIAECLRDAWLVLCGLAASYILLIDPARDEKERLYWQQWLRRVKEEREREFANKRYKERQKKNCKW